MVQHPYMSSMIILGTQEQKYSLVMGSRVSKCGFSIPNMFLRTRRETQFGCCIQNLQSFGNVKRANVEVAERTVHDLVSENMALKAVQRVVFYIKPLKQRVAL